MNQPDDPKQTVGPRIVGDPRKTAEPRWITHHGGPSPLPFVGFLVMAVAAVAIWRMTHEPPDPPPVQIVVPRETYDRLFPKGCN